MIKIWEEKELLEKESEQQQARLRTLSPSKCGFIHLQPAGDILQKVIPGHAPDPNIDDQHYLQALLDSDLWSFLKDDSSLRDRARINTIFAQHAEAWLSALPNPNLGLAMPSKEFVVAVRLRLGLTFFPGPPQSILCPCGAVPDKFSDHLLGCDQKPILL